MPPATRTADDGRLLREVKAGNLEGVEKLLSAGRANPNATDDRGRTPLILATTFPRAKQRFAMVKSLLKAGADAALADEEAQLLPLHLASGLSDTDVMEVLLAAAPGTLNTGEEAGLSALMYAVTRSHGEDAVSFLVSRGAAMFSKTGVSALETALLTHAESGGNENTVRLLLDQGLQAIGGADIVARVLCVAVQNAQARFMPALLDIEGEERRQKWANCTVLGVPLLHCAALYEYVAAAHVLLSAGADETAKDIYGTRASDVMGFETPAEDRNEATEAAIQRMLQRGPAFRARSYCWQAQVVSDDVGVAHAVSGVVSPRPKAQDPLGLRVFRSTNARVLTTRFARYSMN